MISKSIYILSIPFVLAACASEKGGEVYTRDQVRQVQHFKIGTVESVHKIRIEGTKSQIGTVAGAVIGGLAGSGASQGKTGEVAAVLGAVVGGVAGAAAEESLTRENGVEVSIKLESGDFISVVQATSSDSEEIKAGDKVRVIESNGITRVAKY